MIRVYYVKAAYPDGPHIHVTVEGRPPIRCHEVKIHGPSRVIDRGPDVSDAATRVWLETESPISVRVGDEWRPRVQARTRPA